MSNTNRSIINYQKLQIQNESFIASTYLIYTAISSLVLTLMILFSYLIGIFVFKQSISSKKELPKLSQKISQIVKEQVNCYLVNDKTPNAFNAGGNNCYVTKPLYNMLTEKELIAVMLHEYGHYKKLHLFKALGIHISSSILIMSIITLITNLIFGVPIAIFAILALLFGKQVADWYSKNKEFEADEVAVKNGYGKEFLSALKKLESYARKDVCKKLSKKDCEAFFTDIQEKSTTHPPFKERYEKILSSPFFSKISLYFASKIHNDGWSDSLKDNIMGVVDRLVKKIF